MAILIDLASGKGTPRKLLWTTDLHIDATEKTQLEQFYQFIEANDPAAILIGGDISNGYQSLIHLKNMAERLKRPLYFILGNHDFYYGSIQKMRGKVRQLTAEVPNLIYLTESGVIELSPTTALIGHDGWYDGKAGDFLKSDVILNDYFLIEELKNLSPQARLAKLNEMGAEAGRAMHKALSEAFQRYSKVILLTHVPPFLESCMHDGEMCDANWGPHFVSQTSGEALIEVAQQHLEKQLLVLCGHTHAAADVSILPNVRALTGESVLGAPSAQGIIFFD